MRALTGLPSGRGEVLCDTCRELSRLPPARATMAPHSAHGLGARPSSPDPSPPPPSCRGEDAAPSPLEASAAQLAKGAAPSDDDDDAPMMASRSNKEARPGRECPYLDTISRHSLDFDFEKCCSVSLSPVNVYACLVCGHYFQGRGPSTHASAHALETGHHMYMKLEDGRVYCLPEGYEVLDRSLDDIRAVLRPRFEAGEVAKLDADKGASWKRAIDGIDFMPGLVGLNNMRANDYVNVTLQMLARVTALRDYFLSPANYEGCKSELVQRFGELLMKLWNPRNFKGQVSPHEFMRAVMRESGKRFVIDAQSDPGEFLSWLVNSLHLGLTNGKRRKPSIITRCFQGTLKVLTEAGTGPAAGQSEDLVTETPFLMLTLDLPPAPVFQDASEQNIIPQVMVQEVLRKYSGETVTEDVKLGRRRFRLSRLPKYLILNVRRFSRNQFLLEKNPTILNFPVKNLDLAESVREEDLGGASGRFDLLASITHEGPTRMQVDKSVKAMPGTWRAFVHRRAEDAWYEVQDLAVTEVLPQAVALSEAYLQVYEMQ